MEGTITKNMDSVFDQSANDEIEFDVLFDQEDSLIDTVNGVNEAGEPLTGVDFDELHQTHDDATVKDVQAGEGDDNKMGAPNPEGTKAWEPDDNTAKGDIGKESEGDKVRKDADSNYQDGKEGKEVKPDEDHLNDTIDKVAESDEYDDIDDVMMDDDDLDESCKKGCNESSVTDGGSACPKCGQNPCECGNNGDGCSGIDSIEAEIEKQSASVREGSSIDSDVAAVDNADLDGEDKNIEDAQDSKSQSIANKYSYDVSDEELIDIAMGE